MKVLVLMVLAFSLSAVNAARAEDGGKGEDFQKHKDQILKHIDQEISNLQSFKSCVSAAKDHDSMKHCHEQREAQMKEMRAHHQQERRENIDNQIKHLQDEKAKMDQQKSDH